MGIFLRPRRPLMRMAAGATTAAIAYNAGKNRVRQDEYNEQAQAAYAASQAQPQYAPPPQPAPAPAADPLAELERLARLHDSGALSDEEFTTMKARLIGEGR